MDLYDAASSLQRAQDRYQCWREMRSAVTALPPGSAVPFWIRETATAIQAGAALRDRDQARIWIAASAPQIRHDLRRARIEHWYQQGKALRYALILCRNRVERLATEFRTPSPATLPPATPPPAMPRRVVPASRKSVGRSPHRAPTTSPRPRRHCSYSRSKYRSWASKSPLGRHGTTPPNASAASTTCKDSSRTPSTPPKKNRWRASSTAAKPPACRWACPASVSAGTPSPARSRGRR